MKTFFLVLHPKCWFGVNMDFFVSTTSNAMETLSRWFWKHRFSRRINVSVRGIFESMFGVLTSKAVCFVWLSC